PTPAGACARRGGGGEPAAIYQRAPGPASSERRAASSSRPCRARRETTPPRRLSRGGVQSPIPCASGASRHRRHGPDLLEERDHVEVVVDLTDLVAAELDDHGRLGRLLLPRR